MLQYSNNDIDSPYNYSNFNEIRKKSIKHLHWNKKWARDIVCKIACSTCKHTDNDSQEIKSKYCPENNNYYLPPNHKDYFILSVILSKLQIYYILGHFSTNA